MIFMEKEWQRVQVIRKYVSGKSIPQIYLEARHQIWVCKIRMITKRNGK
jgi:hypothetical protein